MMKIITKIVFLFIAVFCMSTTHAIGPQALLNLAGRIVSGQTVSNSERAVFTTADVNTVLTGKTDYDVGTWMRQLQRELIAKVDSATTESTLKDALLKYSYKNSVDIQ